jgi:hypothetical protein
LVWLVLMGDADGLGGDREDRMWASQVAVLAFFFSYLAAFGVADADGDGLAGDGCQDSVPPVHGVWWELEFSSTIFQLRNLKNTNNQTDLCINTNTMHHVSLTNLEVQTSLLIASHSTRGTR